MIRARVTFSGRSGKNWSRHVVILSRSFSFCHMHTLSSSHHVASRCIMLRHVHFRSCHVASHHVPSRSILHSSSSFTSRHVPYFTHLLPSLHVASRHVSYYTHPLPSRHVASRSILLNNLFRHVTSRFSGSR